MDLSKYLLILSGQFSIITLKKKNIPQKHPHKMAEERNFWEKKKTILLQNAYVEPSSAYNIHCIIFFASLQTCTLQKKHEEKNTHIWRNKCNQMTIPFLSFI